jgi:ribonuclease HII
VSTAGGDLSVAGIRALLSGASGARLTRLLSEFAEDEREGVKCAVAAAKRREQRRIAENKRLDTLYMVEKGLRQRGYLVIAGIDEVGRGAVAGPLTACACVLPASPRITGIDDSKRLSPSRRTEIANVIREVALCWSVAHVAATDVDLLGVTRALERAMGRAVSGLELEPDHVVVDGRPVGISREETAVVKGDSKVAAIAAASILAKVARDELMCDLSREHPHYGFDENKGYGTKEHLDAIAEYGLCVHHRRSFLPGGGTQPLF